MRLRVAVVDRSAFVRLAVRTALALEGIDVVGEADTAAAAVSVVTEVRPDAVLIDAEVDAGMACVAEMRRTSPETALIVLSPDDSHARAMRAVRAGACGYLPKDTPPERLPAIVRGAVDGEAAIPRRVVRRLLDHFVGAPAGITSDTPEAPLSAREREVLELLSRGHADGGVGERLGVSAITVRRHVSTAARKLRAPGRDAAIERFKQLGA